MATLYPELGRDRDAWILERRGPKNPVDARRPYAFVLEQELSDEREIVPVAAVFLTNRECPWHCLMCDLWKNTLAETVPIGAIPEQIDFALARLRNARIIKLYNSGSFFDVHAVPPDDHRPIANRVARFDRVVVECHPALVGNSVFRFRDMIAGKLEVAMGLETAHQQTLDRLNKRMTVQQFGSAAEVLRSNGVALRVFILVKPPFQTDDEAAEGCRRSIDFAFSCGASVVSLIPTRGGNGALEALAEEGEFRPPALELLEAALEYGIHLGKGRVFADLWDVEKLSRCPGCFAPRIERLGRINLTQQLEPAVNCALCDSAKHGPAVSPL